MAGQTPISVYREDFPALANLMNGKPLAYLDSAASAQKPSFVLDRMRDFATHHYANIHRGLYHLSQVATQEYENVRRKVAEFINASENEIVFTRNATEGVNLVAQSWGRTFLKKGDEIILSSMEHHANIVPWQILAEQMGAIIRVIPITEIGELDYDAFKALLSGKTKIIAVTQVSNALGTINPVTQIVRDAKAFNSDIKVLVDASQAVVHGGVDVKEIDCDFLVFTGHKLYGPTGVGVLWGKYDVLLSMPPYQGGGDMIETVSFEGTIFKAPPVRFEAGTPAIVEVIGLGAAIDYMQAIGVDAIVEHEKNMLDYMVRAMSKVDGILYHGTAQHKAPLVSFTAEWAQNADIAMILDKVGVAVRSGHHCCMPLMNVLGIEGTIRASIGLYTNENDIDSLVQGLHKAKEMLS
jgi:cysteine desulfurase/selenocysteine lyase